MIEACLSPEITRAYHHLWPVSTLGKYDILSCGTLEPISVLLNWRFGPWQGLLSDGAGELCRGGAVSEKARPSRGSSWPGQDEVWVRPGCDPGSGIKSLLLWSRLGPGMCSLSRRGAGRLRLRGGGPSRHVRRDLHGVLGQQLLQGLELWGGREGDWEVISSSSVTGRSQPIV